MELNDKQKAFVTEYVKDFNATQAAIRAGYSERSARTTGPRLLSDDAVSDAIRRIQTEQLNESIMDLDEACLILSDIARGKAVDFMDENGRVEVQRIRDTHPHAVQSFDSELKIDGNIEDPQYIHVSKLKLHSPINAIQQLAKMLNWESAQKLDVKVEKTFAELMLEARAEEDARKANEGG